MAITLSLVWHRQNKIHPGNFLPNSLFNNTRQRVLRKHSTLYISSHSPTCQYVPLKVPWNNLGNDLYNTHCYSFKKEREAYGLRLFLFCVNTREPHCLHRSPPKSSKKEDWSWKGKLKPTHTAQYMPSRAAHALRVIADHLRKLRMCWPDFAALKTNDKSIYSFLAMHTQQSMYKLYDKKSHSLLVYAHAAEKFIAGLA